MFQKDEISIPIECPECGHEMEETIGRLQRDPLIVCACGEEITVTLDTTGLDAGLAEVEAAMDELEDALDDFGRE